MTPLLSRDRGHLHILNFGALRRGAFLKPALPRPSREPGGASGGVPMLVHSSCLPHDGECVPLNKFLQEGFWSRVQGTSQLAAVTLTALQVRK